MDLPSISNTESSQLSQEQQFRLAQFQKTELPNLSYEQRGEAIMILYQAFFSQGNQYKQLLQKEWGL